MRTQIYDNVILFVPASSEWLRGWLNDRFGENFATEPGFEIFEGSGSYCAFAKKEGIAMGDEAFWVEDLASKLRENIFAIWTHDDADDNIQRYEKGKRIESYWKDMFEFSEHLGIHIPGKPKPRPKTQNSVCLITDVGLDEIPESLVPDGSPIDMTSNQRGVLFCAHNAGTIALSFKLREQFQDKVLYTIDKTSDGRIEFCLFRGWTELGEYAVPPFDGEEAVLDNIEGETDPRKILQRLGISTDMLGLN